MSGKRKSNQLTKDVEKQKKIVRLEKMLLQGITNRTELAAAFGVTRNSIREWILEIEQEWKTNEHDDMQMERTIRIKQIEALAYESLNAWKRSKEDAQETTISYAECTKCRGKGKVKDENDILLECMDCAGDGSVRVETVKLKGQVGDVKFLDFAKECFVECARLKGIIAAAGYAQTTRMQNLIGTAQGIGGQIQEKIETFYLEAPIDTILKAKSMLDELRESVKDDRGGARIIEVKRPEEDGEEPKP